MNDSDICGTCGRTGFPKNMCLCPACKSAREREEPPAPIKPPDENAQAPARARELPSLRRHEDGLLDQHRRDVDQVAADRATALRHAETLDGMVQDLLGMPHKRICGAKQIERLNASAGAFVRLAERDESFLEAFEKAGAYPTS